MKKQTFKNLTLNKEEVSKIENAKGGAHALPTCLGNPCKITFLNICDRS